MTMVNDKLTVCKLCGKKSKTELYDPEDGVNLAYWRCGNCHFKKETKEEREDGRI